MAKYSFTLRDVCEDITGLENQPYRIVIPASAPLLFDFSYPWWKEETRREFEQDLIRHYWVREIGFETIDLFRLKLEDFMKIKMPIYSKLFKACAEDFNIFDVDNIQTIEHGSARTIGNGSADSNSTTKSDTASNGNNLSSHSDTPQSAIENLQNAEYMSYADFDKNNASAHSESTEATHSNNSSDNTSTNDITRTEKGKRGISNSRLLAEYYDAVKSIYDQLFSEMDELFMLVW